MKKYANLPGIIHIGSVEQPNQGIPQEKPPQIATQISDESNKFLKYFLFHCVTYFSIIYRQTVNVKYGTSVIHYLLHEKNLIIYKNSVLVNSGKKTGSFVFF